MPGFGHAFALLFVVLFWGGLIALAIWAVRRFTRTDPADSAMKILHERFARGEIDQQEFEQRKAALRRKTN
jgi:putative membrane protein